MDLTDELLMALRAALAAFLGGFIGLQRERTGHEAGARTHAALALGACLFAVLGGDHRIAAQVVSGVGFLGAGVILHAGRRQQHVKGLTTAATLWATAAIGLTVGYRHYLLSVLCTLLVFGILILHQLPGWQKLARQQGHPPDGGSEPPACAPKEQP